jgi:hypothetical protein
LCEAARSWWIRHWERLLRIACGRGL